MADKKISELDAITGANTAATDVFVVVDTSTGQTKKITREELNNAIEQDVLSSIDIDTINGDFTVNGNINLGDNDKAIFGAGSDLQIYHDGTYNFINAASGQFIFMQADELRLRSSTGETYFASTLNGATSLYHDASLKLATTSTGIDVTGTVTADGLTVSSGSNQITLDTGDQATYGRLDIGHFSNGTFIGTYAGTNAAANILRFGTSGSERMRIDSTGLVGIGTSSPADKLHVEGNIYLGASSRTIYTGGSANLIFQNNTGNMIFSRSNGSSESMRIDSSGNVGIGTTSPAGALHIVNSGLANQLRVSNTTADATTKYGTFLGSHYTNSEEPITGMLLASSSSSTGGSVSIGGGISSANAVNNILFYTAANNTTLGGSERARLDASGNLVVGTTNTTPAQQSSATGISLRTTGAIETAANAGNAARFNRLSSDGSIVEFRKDGTTVGSIGTKIGNAYFAGSSTGITFGSANLYPTNASGVKSDNTLILGSSSYRFKDLRLGGTAYASSAVIEGSSGLGNTEATLQVRSTETMAAGTGGTISLMGDDGTGTQRTFGMIKGAKGNASSGAFGGGLEFYSRTNGVGDAVRRMIIDQQGRVGIGTSAPDKTLVVSSSSGTEIVINDSDATPNPILRFRESGSTSSTISTSSNNLIFSTPTTERFRINSSGKVLIGRTTSTLGGGNGSNLQIGSGTSGAGLTIHSGTSSLGDIQFADGTTGADSYRGLLRYNHTSDHMSIYTNGTESARLESDADLHVDGNVVAYSTTISDIRLKKDIAPIEDAVTKVQQLNGCTFTYLKDDRKSAGLIAQDVEKVLPSAVIDDEAVFHGEEGETYKTVQYDQLIGLLVEAVKELKAEIEELKDASSK